MPNRAIPTDRLDGLLIVDGGLSAEDVSARRTRFGANDIVETPPSEWLGLIRDTARDPMIWFMIGVTVLFAALGDYTEAAILFAALIPLVGMDFYLHRRTQASTQGLSGKLAAAAKVVRGGVAVDIPARELVAGDLVHVAQGAVFPADGVILAGSELLADESILTGEAFPVRKQALSPADVARRSADSAQWGFAGSRLLTGHAELRVAYVGGNTLYGEIVHSATAGTHARTPLQASVGTLVRIMLVFALVVCVALATVRVMQGHGLVDAAISAATLAIAALPEEFPVVFTFFLGVGVYRLARRQALVRRAVAVEDMGRITCICSDKTGTLTEGRLRLEHTVPGPGTADVWLKNVAAQATRLDSGDPLDVALLEAHAPEPAVARLATFPFTEDRRKETAVLRLLDGTCMAVVKGAPETVFALCAMNPQALAHWNEQVRVFGSTGHKVIACATRKLDSTAWPGGEPSNDFVLAGLLAFEDRVRDGVREAVADCQRAGIRVIMVTGDHPATAEAIGRDIGLGAGQPKVINAERATDGDDALLRDSWKTVDIVARAAPAQKLKLVRALQQAGEIVAVTGDGVNDVPALQAADIGIAMGARGAQSAREVAAIVLLDDNFRTIVGAIAEGRQLFRNLQLSFAYLLMIHIPLVLTAALIPLAGFPLLYLPVHIVWLELIIHPTAMLVFQGIPGSGRLTEPVRRGSTRFFAVRDWAAICGVGALATALVLGAYYFALNDGGEVEHARTVALAVLIVAGATVTGILAGLRMWISRIVVVGSLLSLGVLVQVAPVAALVHLRPLHLVDWGIAVAGGVLAGLLALTMRTPARRRAD